MRSDGMIADEYVDWLLLDMLHLTRSEYSRWRDLCEDLFHIDYEWNNDLDQGRANDGIYLRKEFLDDEYPIMIFGEAKVLEVLVEFARRTESEYIGDPKDQNPAELFFMFLENLDLNPETVQCEKDVKNVIFNWMHDYPGLIFGFKNCARNGTLWSFMVKWVSKQ